MSVTAFVTGFLTSGGLLISIGTQNSFVLRQGIRREFVFSVSATCFLCDFILISVGVLGVGQVINDNHYLMLSLTVTGILFLLWYGVNSLKSAWQGTSHLSLSDENIQNKTRLTVVMATFSVSLLNPQVWLDTVAIVGGVSSSIETVMKPYYLFGALAASFLWFVSISYLASLLTRYFVKSITWKILDSFIGLYMLFMAWKLSYYVVLQ